MATDTFGETGTGTNDFTVGYEGMIGSVFTSPSDVDVLTMLSCYCRAGAAGAESKGLLFDVSGGAPANKLATSSNTVSLTTAWVWAEYNFNYSLTPNIEYGLVMSNDNVSSARVRVQSQAGDEVNRKAATYCSEPSSWGADSPYADYHICIFATYTVAAPPAVGGVHRTNLYLGLAHIMERTILSVIGNGKI